MDERQKMKRMVNELMNMQTDDMTVYINVYRDSIDAEFYSAEAGMGIGRQMEWDTFYVSTEEMVDELNEAIRINKEIHKCTQA